MEPSSCAFCIDSLSGNQAVEPERIMKEYDSWWLVLQPEAKRAKTVQAAGMLVLKRHAPAASQATAAEFGEIPLIMHDASALLCETVGTDYMDQTRLGFNEGLQAGQTIDHMHVHVLPVGQSDPAELKVRGGIGGAFEALRTVRLKEKVSYE